jgi:hypothetical protein
MFRPITRQSEDLDIANMTSPLLLTYNHFHGQFTLTTVTLLNIKRVLRVLIESLMYGTKEEVKVKASPVTGSGGSCVFETSRLLHFLENRLRDGGEVVSLAR